MDIDYYLDLNYKTGMNLQMKCIQTPPPVAFKLTALIQGDSLSLAKVKPGLQPGGGTSCRSRLWVVICHICEVTLPCPLPCSASCKPLFQCHARRPFGLYLTQNLPFDVNSICVPFMWAQNKSAPTPVEPQALTSPSSMRLTGGIRKWVKIMQTS